MHGSVLACDAVDSQMRFKAQLAGAKAAKLILLAALIPMKPKREMLLWLIPGLQAILAAPNGRDHRESVDMAEKKRNIGI